MAAAGAGEGCAVAVFPPFTALEAVAAVLAGSPVGLGGQDCHEAEAGAHTGSVSAAMLADLGCRYVIVGHSERRHGLGETSGIVCAKAEAAIGAGLVPIVCVGETLEQREAGQAEATVAGQIARSVPDGDGRIVLAYEPVWAIGTGRTASTADIAAMHAGIRARLAERRGGRRCHPHPVWRFGQAGQRRRNSGPRQCRRRAGRRRQPGCAGRFRGDRAGGGVGGFPNFAKSVLGNRPKPSLPGEIQSCHPGRSADTRSCRSAGVA